MRGNSLLADDLLRSQEVVTAMELIVRSRSNSLLLDCCEA